MNLDTLNLDLDEHPQQFQKRTSKYHFVGIYHNLVY